jgi:hypothetical protein
VAGPYDLTQLTDVQVGSLLGRIQVHSGERAGDDLRDAVSALFAVKAQVTEVKESVWLVTIPMPAPREGELEAIIIHGTQELPEPIWRPRRQSLAKRALALVRLAPRPVLSPSVVVYDLGRW